MERETTLHALEQARYNKTAAARILGITFRTLRYRLKELELERGWLSLRYAREAKQVDDTLMTVMLQRHRLTVNDYHKMGEAGILSEEDRVEIIRREMIDMAPIGSAHAACVRHLLHFFPPSSRITLSLISKIPFNLMITQNPSRI